MQYQFDEVTGCRGSLELKCRPAAMHLVPDSVTHCFTRTAQKFMIIEAVLRPALQPKTM